MNQALARQLFDYIEGKLYWRVKPSSKVKIGDEVGYIHPTGYRRFMYKRKGYAVHRIIWLMQYNNLPLEIDHKDTDKLNNKIENLRIANNKNQQNVNLRIDNTSGAKNVYWNKLNKKWSVIVSSDNKRHNIGYFEDLELAELVAIMAREKYHGVYANHG